MSSIFLFIKRDLIDALIGLAINIIIFPLVAFICGFVYGQFKKPVNQSSMRFTSFALLAISLIGFIAGVKSLSDSHMFDFGALARAQYDVWLVVASYFGALVIPTCFLLLGLRLYKNSKSEISVDKKFIFTKSYVVGSFIGIGLVILVLFIFNLQPTHKSSWIPIIKTVFYNYSSQQFESSTTYIDINSFRKKDGFLYADIGNEFEKARSSDLAKSTKQVIQVDCEIPKFRFTEVYTYKKSPLDGFGELISSNANLQASLAKLTTDSGGTYSGGWATRASLVEELVNRCDLSPTKSMDAETEKSLCDSTRRELAIMKFACETK
jgi:hypothetical protein